jgi:hypothetical protein
MIGLLPLLLAVSMLGYTSDAAMVVLPAALATASPFNPLLADLPRMSSKEPLVRKYSRSIVP